MPERLMTAVRHGAAPAFALVFTLISACAQRGAPVVDLPVRGEPSGSRPTVTAQAGAAAPSKAAEPGAAAPAKTAGPVAGAPAATPAPASPQPAVRAAQPTVPAPANDAREGDWRPEFYTVKKGDTLYSIALDHGQGYRDVAAWNGLTDPNLIRVDQQLRVRPPADWKEPPEDEEGVVARPVAPPPQIEAKALEPPPVKKAPKAVKLAYSEQALAQLRGVRFKPSSALAPRTPRTEAPAGAIDRPAAAAGTPAAAGAQTQPAAEPSKPAALGGEEPGKPARIAASEPAGGVLAWSWPARGPLLHGFSQGSNPKGIAIGGEAGQPILAVAAGKVVYSGSGLRGYGKLVIIKHDATYLSVYAHNRQLLVKEGERVARGQKIAEMGSSDAERPELHFEIRRLGKPVDPLQYLPAQGG